MARPDSELSAAQARQLALRAQQLWRQPRTRAKPAAIPPLVRQLGAVQIDTISVLARNHQLVLNARLGALPKAELEQAIWPAAASPHFEYWSHAACVLPVADWPLFEFRRQAFRAKGERWHQVPKRSLSRVVDQVRDLGPVTTTEVGGARQSAAWWDWSESKIALEWLLDIGVLACTRRLGFRRQYDLAERAIPAANLGAVAPEPALLELLNRSLKVLGVGTRDDILDIHRLRLTPGLGDRDPLKLAWQKFIQQPDVVAVSVPGWGKPAWARMDSLAELDRSRPNRAVMLSPFDSLIWHRPRMQRLFGMTHQIEAYTPAAKRVYGYFAMPVLAGDRLVARVDPARDQQTLRAVKVTFEAEQPDDRDIQAVASALAEAAGWVSANRVLVESCRPARCKPALNQALAAIGVK